MFSCIFIYAGEFTLAAEICHNFREPVGGGRYGKNILPDIMFIKPFHLEKSSFRAKPLSIWMIFFFFRLPTSYVYTKYLNVFKRRWG